VLALAQRELAANEGARAAQRFLEVRAALPDYGFDAALVARLVPHLREMYPELAKQALRWLAQPKSAPLAPTLAQRAVDQARELDALVAKQLARKLAATELPEEMRERFAALARALEAEAPDPPKGETGGIELASEAGAANAFRGAAHEDPTPDWDHTARDFEDDDSQAPSAAGERGPGSPSRSRRSQAKTAPSSEQGIASPDDEWDALKLLDAEEAALPAPEPRFASLKTTEATPLALLDGALRISLEGGRTAQLPLARVDAVALAAVRGLAAKPVLVVDLLLGWRSLAGGELRCVRLRSDRFDPRRLAPAPDPLSALRALVAQLVAATGAATLHAADPARQDALTPFADLATYEREVLEVG
jgi:hypothetical protein